MMREAAKKPITHAAKSSRTSRTAFLAGFKLNMRPPRVTLARLTHSKPPRPAKAAPPFAAPAHKITVPAIISIFAHDIVASSIYILLKSTISSRLSEFRLPSGAHDGREYNERIKLAEDLRHLAGESRRGEEWGFWLENLANDPGLERLPVLDVLGKSCVDCPLALFRAMPVGLVAASWQDFSDELVKKRATGFKALAKNGFEPRSVGPAAVAVNREAHGHAFGTEADVKAPGIAPLAAAVEDVKVIIRLVRTLVFAETDVAVNAREVSVGLPGGLEVRIELEKKRLKLGEQGSKCAGHVRVIAGAVQVEPWFVIILGELPEKSEGFRRKSPKPAFYAHLGHRLRTSR